MKSLTETRALLLSQHDGIRDQVAAALRACSSTPVDQATLKEALGLLAVGLREHNSTEEDALRNVLPGLDMFGAVRKSVMISDHVAEHEELQAALLAAGDGESVARISALLDRLLGHMEHEENLFLGPQLLQD